MRLPRPGRLSALLLAVPLLALPAAALVVRLTVHFSASFDTATAPGTILPVADIGSFATTAPPDEFVVVPAPGKGSWLKIQDGGVAADAVLTGQFHKPFKGTEVTLSFSASASQTDAGLIVGMFDDGGSGMIDVEFDDESSIIVGDVRVAGYDEEQTVGLVVTLRDPIVGPETWHAAITVAGVTTFASGPLSLSKPLAANVLRITRPAGSGPAEFFIDDLKVVSNGLSPNF